MVTGRPVLIFIGGRCEGFACNWWASAHAKAEVAIMRPGVAKLLEMQLLISAALRQNSLRRNRYIHVEKCDIYPAHEGNISEISALIAFI